MTRGQLSLALFASLSVGACSTAAADARYPSLAQRPVEREQGQFEPVAVKTLAVPPVETGLTGPLPERLAALVAQAERAHAGFTGSERRARQLAGAARGAAVASDAWASAQVALADLDSARSEAAIALGSLDTLYIAATVQSEDAAAIAAARDQVIALVAAEDAVLEDLRAQVR